MVLIPILGCIQKKKDFENLFIALFVRKSKAGTKLEITIYQRQNLNKLLGWKKRKELLSCGKTEINYLVRGTKM